MIERAYTLAEALGMAVWCEDEAGPYQTVPYPGASWQPEGAPLRQPHEYFQEGTAKMLTLFHPATGQLRVKGTPSTRNAILHPWLKTELAAILAELPPPVESPSPEANRALWESWREGLSRKVSLCADRPPLRLLLVMDNLTGHKSPGWLVWCFQRGILPLFTPLGGSWLNMAESIQCILQRRALAGQYPLESRPLSPGLQRRQWAGIGIRLPWYGEANAPCVVNVPANGDSIACLALALAPCILSGTVNWQPEWL